MSETTFQEPKSMEEAKRRRLALTEETLRLQNELSNANVQKNNRRLNGHEWAAWREIAKKQWLDKLEELRLVKAWIGKNHAMLKRQVSADMEIMLNACRDLKELVKNITGEAFAMKEKLEELTAENNALYKRIQDLELENTNQAPGHGREEWRHDDNLDKPGSGV